MTKKTFIPQQWLTTESSTLDNTANQPEKRTVADNLETIVQRVETSRTDITGSYMDWRNIGFALADELGEGGRATYHRLSRFYANYKRSETDRQFDKCLQSHGHGITIKTLFYLAEQAGVDISVSSPNPKTVAVNDHAVVTDSGSDSGEPAFPELPTFPDEVYAGLPDLLIRATCKMTSPEERDLLLLGSLVAISACLPNIYGIYAEREVYPNLFLFVTAQASAGKGRLSLCRRIVEPVHQALRMQSKNEYEAYKRQEAEYTIEKKKKAVECPKEPPMRMLIVPANSSATGIFQILNDNNGIGLIFETEGDTLTQAFKSEHGNYSDGLRKAFHHEIISYHRRKDREYVEMISPRVSALLSGTPRQVGTLIPNSENRLFSRFIFYCMNLKPVWNDVFAHRDEQTLDHYFSGIGEQFHIFYKQLQSLDKPYPFFLTRKQEQIFHLYFTQIQEQYLYLCGPDFIATVRRLGLITFRIAMILTTLRARDTGYLGNPLTCSDADFQITLSMIKILVQHAAAISLKITEEQTEKKQHFLRQLFFEKLPDRFCREEYLKAADKLNIKSKTAESYISYFTKKKKISFT